MAEIKREPLYGRTYSDVDGYETVETVTFDETHTISDIVRYLLTQTDREELAYLVRAVDA